MKRILLWVCLALFVCACCFISTACDDVALTENGVADAKGIEVEETSVSKIFKEEILPNALAFVSGLGGVVIGIAAIYSKFKQMRTSLGGFVQKSDADAKRLNEEYAELKKSFDSLKKENEMMRQTFSEAMDKIGGVSEDAHKTREMCRLAFASNPDMVRSGVADEIVKLDDTAKDVTDEE